LVRVDRYPEWASAFKKVELLPNPPHDPSGDVHVSYYEMEISFGLVSERCQLRLSTDEHSPNLTTLRVALVKGKLIGKFDLQAELTPGQSSNSTKINLNLVLTTSLPIPSAIKEKIQNQFIQTFFQDLLNSTKSQVIGS
jgi:hypothetical protein